MGGWIVFAIKSLPQGKRKEKKDRKIMIIINDQVCEQYTNVYKLGANWDD
jgi:hypothetical protein